MRYRERADDTRPASPRFALLLLACFIAAAAGEYRSRLGPVVRLACAADPRDLFAGDYMSFRLEISDIGMTSERFLGADLPGMASRPGRSFQKKTGGSQGGEVALLGRFVSGGRWDFGIDRAYIPARTGGWPG